MTEQSTRPVDILTVERRAHELRAQALRAGIIAMIAWLRGRKPVAPTTSPHTV